MVVEQATRTEGAVGVPRDSGYGGEKGAVLNGAGGNCAGGSGAGRNGMKGGGISVARIGEFA